MNKTELIQALAEKTGVNKVTASAMLDAFQEVVTDELKAKGSIALLGFGTFQVKEKPARLGRNPSTGEALNLPAKTVPVFKPGSVLSRAVQ